MIPVVTPQVPVSTIDEPTLQEYQQIVPDQIEAGRLAAIDKIWLQVMKEYNMLGSKKQQKFLWEDHQGYMQGLIDEDPIMKNGDAKTEFLKRVQKMFGGEDADR